MKFTGRASGKFILMGEHFVVHGSPALAFPLPSLWCEVVVSPNDVPHYSASYEGVQRGNENEDMIKSLMRRATQVCADSLCINLSSQPLKVESKANFPVSRGFGSSAAFSVALSRALLSYRTELDQTQWSLTNPHAELLKTSFRIEKVFHGNPSGVDTTVILEEHGIRFQKKYDGTVDVEKINNICADFILVDAGVREPSEILIEKISRIQNERPEDWSSLLQLMNTNIDLCRESLEKSGGIMGVAEAVKVSHGILNTLELSTPAVESILEIGKSIGVLAGKISGAGGGGATLLVCEKGTAGRIATKLKDKGVPLIAISRGISS